MLYAAIRHHGPLEIYARATSQAYFERLAIMFDIEEKADFQPIFDELESKKLRLPRWEFHYLNVKTLMGFDKLETRP